MNYLEELACWYFRLNGYFLISDFVNHRDSELLYTYDTDFLGIRFPYVYESVGGNVNDFDSEIISSSKICCVIGQAKSGAYQRNQIFTNKNLLIKNIYRLGVFPSEEVEQIADVFFNACSWENEQTKLLKVLVESEQSRNNEKYISINKDKIVREIRRRREIYRKEPDRLFFNSSLIQYLFSE